MDIGGAEQNYFKLLEQRLASAPVLGYLDYTQTHILDTFAGRVGVGAVLSIEETKKKGDSLLK